MYLIIANQLAKAWYARLVQRQRIIIIALLSFLLGLSLGWAGNWIGQSWSDHQLLSPLSESDQLPDLPYLPYTIPALAQQPIAPSSISIDSLLESTDTFNSYLFSYSATGGKITGQLNLPTNQLTQ